LAHVDAGKTSLTERLLETHVIDAIGIDDGTLDRHLDLERRAASRSRPRSCRSSSTTSSSI
jgi:translation elongation factor EF-G